MKKSVRLFDLTIAVILSIVLFIPMIIVAILIKLTSEGPIIYKQKRLGYLGKEFEIYKFRTMTVGSDRTGSITIGNDRRITKIGKFLRKSKVDEFPQLLNIFKGEMGFVGPRPDTPEYKEFYENSNPEFFKLVPGITGKASIYLSNEEELMATVANPKTFYIEEIIPKKVELNNYHLKNNGISYNILVMFETVFKVMGLIKNNN